MSEKQSAEMWAVIGPNTGFRFPFATHCEEWAWKTFVETWTDNRWGIIAHHEHLEKLSAELREMGYRPVKVRVEEIDA